MKRRFFPLLGLTALLLGSDGGGSLQADNLPHCAAGTYLGFHGGQLACLPLLPDCTDQLLTAGPGGTPLALHCTPIPQGYLSEADRQRISDLKTELQAAETELSALGVIPALSATYVGMTTDISSGRIEFPGAAAGLPAANARCVKEFGANAHLCASRELVGANLNGTFDPQTDSPNGWIYMPTWNHPLPGAEQPLSGLGDNCGGYTDASSTHGWSGMAVAWNLDLANVRVLRFLGGTAVPCATLLPLACCK